MSFLVKFFSNISRCGNFNSASNLLESPSPSPLPRSSSSSKTALVLSSSQPKRNPNRTIQTPDGHNNSKDLIENLPWVTQLKNIKLAPEEANTQTIQNFLKSKTGKELARDENAYLTFCHQLQKHYSSTQEVRPDLQSKDLGNMARSAQWVVSEQKPFHEDCAEKKAVVIQALRPQIKGKQALAETKLDEFEDDLAYFISTQLKNQERYLEEVPFQDIIRQWTEKSPLFLEAS